MARSPRIALLGFLPWADPQRGDAVRENPAALAAELAARRLAEQGQTAAFIPVPVSGAGIQQALETVRLFQSEVIVALGQTPTEPRVERQGTTPGAWTPVASDEVSPWVIAPDADELATALNELNDPVAETAPFRVSDNAGGYFCDHLCVELGREVRRRPIAARFLHVTAIDGCSPSVREARLRQFERQALATVSWLLRPDAQHR